MRRNLNPTDKSVRADLGQVVRPLGGSTGAIAGFLVSSWFLCLPMLLAGCSDGDPTASDPALVFEDGFINAPSEVTVLSEGGTIVRGLDAWLKLQPKQTAIVPRQRDEYAYRDCAAPLAWFSEVTGDRTLQADARGLVCEERIDPRFDFDNGSWLVTDRHHGLVYYRIWKKYP